MSARNSWVGMEDIEYTMHLVFDDQGGARMTRTAGKLRNNERALELKVKLPKKIFKRPSLTASIAVEAPDISIPPIAIDAATNALRDAFGADVLLTVQTQEQP